MRFQNLKFHILRFPAILLAGCAAPAPPVDVERDKIRSWVDAYAAAAVRAERTRLMASGEYPAAVAEMHARRADLERIRSDPDGRRYTEEEIGLRRKEGAARIAFLRRREAALTARTRELTDEDRVDLGRVVEERYDLEIRGSRLAHLRKVLVDGDPR